MRLDGTFDCYSSIPQRFSPFFIVANSGAGVLQRIQPLRSLTTRKNGRVWIGSYSAQHIFFSKCARFTNAVNEIQVHFLTGEAAVFTVHVFKQLLDVLDRRS
jgi:hypothetical protein